MTGSIIFDAEGVVIDTEPLWDKAQSRLLNRRGLDYDRNRVKHLIAGRSAIEGMTILQAEYGILGDAEQLAAERARDMEELLAEGVQFIDGFEMFFASIRRRLKTCIATAMPKPLMDIVDRKLNLGALFGQNIFYIADVGYRSKPDPALFLYAAARLRADPSECLVIEDSPNGIEAAKNGGMRCFGLATTFSPAMLRQTRADFVASGYQDIALELDRMLQTTTPVLSEARPGG